MNDFPKQILAWHEVAMNLAETAFFAIRKGEYHNYWKYIQRALNYEKAAARFLKDNITKDDPTRSILYQGAVHFAINLNYLDEAKYLLNEALDGFTPVDIKNELETLKLQIGEREIIKSRILAIINNFLDGASDLSPNDIDRAINAAVAAEALYQQKDVDKVNELLNTIAVKISLENKNLVSNPDYQIFEDVKFQFDWILEKKNKLTWSFWKAYKVYLEKNNFASTTIKKLDLLTDDILMRIGDPSKGGSWNKKGLIVGDVQSGKTSNYIGLINKAADLGFHIIIILSGLYENLRQQTQQRIDEGFTGFISDINSPIAGQPTGVEFYRKPKNIPVQPITRAGEAGDLRKSNLPNLSLTTNDYYAIVVKKNPFVLKALLNWLYTRADIDGSYRIIKNIPLLVIDDEADYASINVDKEFVSKINGSIRATLSLFEQSAFVGYTATPFANIFISDFNETKGKEIIIDNKRFRLGEDLFPKDFIINLPPPSNYIGYSKVFDSQLEITDDLTEGDLPMINIIDDHDSYIPQGHVKDGPLPTDIPPSLKRAINCFVIVCSVRLARGQVKEHNSMLVHVSWFVRWIDNISLLINDYLEEIKLNIKLKNISFHDDLKIIYNTEFKIKTNSIQKQINFNDPRLIEHDWIEVAQFLQRSVEKIEVRAVHGSKRDLVYSNNDPLNYNEHRDGLYVIAVGGNKLSRGLTLEGLSISYFLRASRFYDTLLQMGRWFGYKPGFVDLCRLFTTDELVTWYQYIANATEELKEQFDIMDLAERTPNNFGLKVRSAPGMLMISSAAKIKGATDLSLSYSGDLTETYSLSKSLDALQNNLLSLHHLIEGLGDCSGTIRQGQSYIWENIKYKKIENFISDYKINQPNINPILLRDYINEEVQIGNLNNWTIVLINNSLSNQFYTLKTMHKIFEIGYTFRKEVEEKDAFGNIIINPQKYLIRKSHIISPPHEYLDMDQSDPRYINAIIETQIHNKTMSSSTLPLGRFIRKHRGANNILLLLYLLDPKGFNGKPELPALGFAISFPEIQSDIKIPYKVNQQFIEQMFAIPYDAEENPEQEEEDI